MDGEVEAMANKKKKRKKRNSEGRPQTGRAWEDRKDPGQWLPERRGTYQANEDVDRTKEWEDDK
jgi:hypothetical protein